ncbi:DUF262 domain-containing protein [Gordonia paraffinivorans]|uniref:DUF262 domain-containing protein n=1 Tax=Gordonia paraffinivorans TaxID=175628 RepID=UPI0024317BBC|nr:DUF262 domain-containing protein [Gordonia paraffinivorans]
MQMTNIFDAAPYSVLNYLVEPGLGLYLPPYQRPYDWGNDNIVRLVTDIGLGIQQTFDTDDSICFLGSVIMLEDNQLTTVEPIYRSDTPGRVMSVIDGQQRLTSIFLLLTVLHEEVRTRTLDLPDSDAGRWCRNQSRELCAKISSACEQDMHYSNGSERYRFYPKMIRAYIDAWSRDDTQAKYESPIARYLFEFSSHNHFGSADRPPFDFAAIVKGAVNDGRIEVWHSLGVRRSS